MLKVKVDLEFSCCECSNDLSVTVQCAGKSLAMECRAVAAVSVPCPTCGHINQVYFEPTGKVHAVKSYENPFRRLEPSVN